MGCQRRAEVKSTITALPPGRYLPHLHLHEIILFVLDVFSNLSDSVIYCTGWEKLLLLNVSTLESTLSFSCHCVVGQGCGIQRTDLGSGLLHFSLWALSSFKK